MGIQDMSWKEIVETAEGEGACGVGLEVARSLGSLEEAMKSKYASEWACWWADKIGDREYMRQFVTGSKWVY